MKKSFMRSVLSYIMVVVMVLSAVPVYSFALEAPDNYYLAHDEEIVIAPGITQSESVIYKPDGKRVEMFAAVADTSVSTVQLAVNYKDNQCEKYGMQKLSEQVAAAEKNHAEPYTVAAAINASFYDMDIGFPYGAFIMDGNVKIDTGGAAFFAVLKDGTPIIAEGRDYKQYKGNIQHAVSGNPLLIKDGRINSEDGETIDDGAYGILNPRAAVGITADNKVVFFTADGRNEPKSAGMTAYETAEIMLSLGCVYALNLDGGGSSTFGSKVPGGDFKIQNNPSDGTERSISTSIMMISTAEATGEFDHAYLKSDYDYLTCSTSIPLTPVGLDSADLPAPIPESGLSWSVSDSSMGSVDSDGVFTACDEGEGKVTVYLDYNGNHVASKELTVIVPDSVEFTKKKINVTYGERVLLPICGYWNSIPVAINENDFISVHEYEFNESVHESLFEDYGYYDGMYFITPQEEMGIRSETLYLVAAFDEEAENIYTLKLEFHNEGDEYFDFESATASADDKLSWYRDVSNSTTNDDFNYTLIDNSAPVYITYKFGVAMDAMELPEELQPMWDSFAGALGDNVWDAFLKLAKKIDSSTNVTIDFALDEHFEFADISGIRLVNNLFIIDSSKTEYIPETNSVRVVMRWNQSYINELLGSEEGMTSDTVNSTVIVDNVKLRLKEGTDLSAAAGLTVVNNFNISYTLIAISDSAYGVAANNPQLSDFAYQDGNRKGIRFQATYLESSDKFRLFEAEEASDGWQGDSYFKDGNAVTGINYLPSKENADESFYYEFDENGICNGKYTGIVREDGKIIYSQDGSPDFAGLVRTDGGDYYYFDETLEAAGAGEVYISKTNGFCAEGSYTVLEDKRVVLEKSEEFISVSEFDEAAEAISAVSVSAGDTVTTGASVTLYSEGRLTIKTAVKSGDVDCDGFSDGRDAVLIECIAGGMLASSDITAAQMRAADCNSDSLIDQNDIDLAVQSGLNI